LGKCSQAYITCKFVEGTWEPLVSASSAFLQWMERRWRTCLIESTNPEQHSSQIPFNEQYSHQIVGHIPDLVHNCSPTIQVITKTMLFQCDQNSICSSLR
jgi:hypothetical protein